MMDRLMRREVSIWGSHECASFHCYQHELPYIASHIKGVVIRRKERCYSSYTP